MGHKNKKSLTRQVQEILDSKLKIGCSRYDDKKRGVADQYIYSYGTYRTYLKHNIYFVKWCKEQYGCKTVRECEPYIKDWIGSRRNLSPYTLKMELAALAKLYGKSSEEFHVSTPARKMENITRSRGSKERDKHFSKERHADLITFCRCTGLRRSELSALHGNKFIEQDGHYFILIDSGSKGGKYREAPIIGSPKEIETVLRLMQKAGNDKVFPIIPSAADIHAYRAEYAGRVYRSVARKISDIPYDSTNAGTGKRYQGGVYVCRNGRKGKKMDKTAMDAVSRALGHNRICVVGEHYLWTDDE